VPGRGASSSTSSGVFFCSTFWPGLSQKGISARLASHQGAGQGAGIRGSRKVNTSPETKPPESSAWGFLGPQVARWHLVRPGLGGRHPEGVVPLLHS
jgi:hypothetical protein